ncbi:MAG: hypothetical protein ACFFD4_39440 [Candidatus Odinarchaeota archaeon]
MGNRKSDHYGQQRKEEQIASLTMRPTVISGLNERPASLFLMPRMAERRHECQRSEW